jgi:hypothetical protein
MSSPNIPQQPNIGSSSQNSNIAMEMAGRLPSTSVGMVNGQTGQLLSQNVGKAIDMAGVGATGVATGMEGGSIDGLYSGPGGEGFDGNPFTQIFDGQLLGGPNVNAFQTLARDPQLSGDMSAINMGVAKQVNAPSGLPGIAGQNKGNTI